MWSKKVLQLGLLGQLQNFWLGYNIFLSLAFVSASIIKISYDNNQ
jgi:hypothetical protein